MTRYDVAVVGGGPSGSTTAYHLARAGARVLVVDRARFPREKPCGGGVTARAFAQAPVDLTPRVENVVSRVRFSFRLGRFFDYTYARPLVFMTQRIKLDAFLLDQAAQAGAAVRDGVAVSDIEVGRDVVRLRAGGEAIEAGVLVGADGANGSVAKAAGLAPVSDAPVALEANFPYESVPPEWRDLLALELGSLSGGYGWSFPKSDHFNVGCGGWREEGPRLRDHLRGLRRYYGLDGVAMLNLRGHHLPTRDGPSPIHRGRVLLTGDAAGLVDPMSGEGIHAAFVSGRLAAGASLRFLDGREPDLYSYEAGIEREVMPDLRAAAILRDAYHYTPRPCFEGLKRSELLRRSLCQIITGERTYADFLKMIGPLATFLRLWGSRGRAARRSRTAAFQAVR